VRPFGNRAVHFAGTIDRVRGTALDAAAMDMARLDQADADMAGDTSHRLAPADDTSDRLLVHAILQRDDIATRRQILLDQYRRPLRVVGFGANERDVDRCFLAQLLCLSQVQCPHLDRERVVAVVVSDVQAVFVHFFDMRGPHVDEGHVFAGPRHMRPGIAAQAPTPTTAILLPIYVLPAVPRTILAPSRALGQLVPLSNGSGTRR
jgi:hypothetical protein